MEAHRTLEGIEFPHGGEVAEDRAKRREPPIRIRNARVARSLDLSGMRVLDAGCGVGLYTLYMADSAKEVIGIDHSLRRIEVADGTRQALGYENVRFEVVDTRDTDSLRALGRFDLIVGWGFLHRVPDMFSLLFHLSQMTEAFSFEWMTPVFPFMRRASLAYHRNEVDVLDTSNLVSPSTSNSEGRKAPGKSGFWCPTPFAVQSILRKCGFGHSRILGYGEQLGSQWPYVLKQLLRTLVGQGWTPFARVHMIVEKRDGLVRFKSSFRDADVPHWDVAGKDYLARK